MAQATAGAHVVAPSGMMDGQVGAHPRRARRGRASPRWRSSAYSAKYASGLYGPFRDAVDVTIAGGGDRKGYQQDWRNAREALVEVRADLAQGADMVMVKPALAYLDVIAAVRAEVDVPLAAYHVSGEYSMIKAAAANGWIDHDVVALEHLTAIKRAGADLILTYLTRWFAERAVREDVMTIPLLPPRALRRRRLRPGGVHRRRHAVERRACSTARPPSSPAASTRRSERSSRSAAARTWWPAPRAPHVWDVEGTRYIDLVQSYGAVILGHAHPAITAAVIERGRRRHVVRRADPARDEARRGDQRARRHRASRCGS